MSTKGCMFLFTVRTRSAWHLVLITPYLTHTPVSNPSCMVCRALVKSPSSSIDAGVSFSTFSHSAGDVDLLDSNGLGTKYSPPHWSCPSIPPDHLAVSLDN